MKRKLLNSFLLVLTFITTGSVLLSQVPEGFNYMAIARDGENNILANQSLQVIISILDGDATTVYDEQHLVSTNDDGIFQLIVGLGDPLYGGYTSVFDDIDWSMQPLFIKTQIYFNTSWLDMGNAQLFSVPYAMVSKYSYGGVDNPFVMNGDTVVLMKSVDVVGNYPVTEEEALFEVRRQDGQTMFAVYNQGVRINIPMDDAVKGAKGGFAIGGFSGYKGTTHNLFVLNKDSARIFLDKSPDLLPKGAKGGFAIGGFAYTGKADVIQDYLFVAPDSARIYVKEATKGAKGGFAIGGFGTSKATPTNFMDITPKNYFIGHQSGSKVSTGQFNSVVGYQAGKSLSTGSYNTILGNMAGTSVNTGNNNIIVGDNAGYSMSNAYSNTIIGYRAGHSLTDQSYNVFVGHESGMHVNSPGWNGGFNAFFGVASGWAIRTSRDNTFLGINAGMFLDNGTGNVFIGTDAGRAGPDPGTWVPRAFTSSNNTFIGTSSGYNNTQGNNNVSIGHSSGLSLQTGSGNIFLGYSAGGNETGSNKLYITNKLADPPLMYGDFSVNQLGINTKTLGKTLNVGGDAYVSGNLQAGSITAPVTGNVNGNLTGNVTGNVNGNLTGSVNGVETGRIFLDNNGEIQYTANHEFILHWNMEGIVTLENNTGKWPCHYWWRLITKEATTDGNGFVEDTPVQIIVGANDPGAAFEVHFGFPDPGAGYCSVWVQFIEGILVGHYMKY